jgi:hypothetical protein
MAIVVYDRSEPRGLVGPRKNQKAALDWIRKLVYRFILSEFFDA